MRTQWKLRWVIVSGWIFLVGDLRLVLQNLSHLLTQHVFLFLKFIHSYSFPLIRHNFKILRNWRIDAYVGAELWPNIACTNHHVYTLSILFSWDGCWRNAEFYSWYFWSWSNPFLLLQYLNEALAHVRSCSRLVELLSRKKLIMQSGDSLAAHKQKVFLMILLLFYFEEIGESHSR